MANYLTQQDVSDYGSDLVDFAQRAAVHALGPHLQQIQEDNVALRQRLARELRARLDAAVERAVPELSGDRPGSPVAPILAYSRSAQLHFLLEVRSLCFGLVSASPERPCDDASGLDAPLRELEGDTTDFLDRPADQERRLIDRRGNVFLGPTTAALAR